MSMTGGLVGGLSSLLIVALYLVTFHKKFFISLAKTLMYCGYGVYTEFGEALMIHYGHLLRGLFVVGDKDLLRVEWEKRVKSRFLEHYLRRNSDESLSNDESHNVLITHSCRSIFYYIIKFYLEEAVRLKGESHIKIATGTVHFGSFYRLLRGMEQSMNCTIELYEIDLKEEDWTLDQASIDERELATCDLIMAQHLFGVPFEQERLFALGKKHNIPIVEDCVQSGSLFGKYRGDARADVVLYSGGLDKTPSCLGAGFGYFRRSERGQEMYDGCCKIHRSLPVDTWKARFVACFNQSLHIMFAKNTFYIYSLIGLLAYVYVSEPGDYIKWYPMSLKIRKTKSITPFQHAESGFCRQPSLYQLWSMMYGMSEKKTKQYAELAQGELEGRDLLLSHIPPRFHRKLFPWWTNKVLQSHRDNRGISEFSWVVSPEKDRIHICDFINNEFLIVMINTTWEFHEHTKCQVGKDINENLVYLPNINQLTDSQIIRVAKALTKYCNSLEDSKRNQSKSGSSKEDTKKIR